MKFFGSILLGIFLVLVTAELLLRGQEMILSPELRYNQAMMRGFFNNIFSVILSPGQDRVPFFHPPYKMFNNYGYQDEKRLEMIFRETLGPVGTSVRTNDPLMPESKEKFLVSLNKLGFRGKDREVKKSPATKRIIVLGSYQAWGLGVNDDETYSAQLENRLNLHKIKHRHYEVWNAGRMTSTAIVGLAHLKKNVLPYKPDLVILDYGFVDSMMLHQENSFIKTSGSPILHKLISYSLLLQKIRAYVRSMAHVADPLPNFRGAMNEMISFLRSHDVPILLVQQNFSSTINDYFREAEKAGVPVISINEVMAVNPPSYKLWEKTTWMKKVRENEKKELPIYEFAPYYKNPFQLNSAGHAILALKIEEMIMRGPGLIPSEKKLLDSN